MKINTTLRHGYMLLNDNIKKQITRVDDNDDGEDGVEVEDEDGDDGIIIMLLYSIQYGMVQIMVH